MDPRVLISYHGDSHVNLQKNLQSRLKALQLTTLKDEPLYSAFSAVCDGVEFVPLRTIQARAKSQRPQAVHERAALHTYWTSTCDHATYRTHDFPRITQWLADVERLGDTAECVIIYCITAEVRARRHRTIVGGGVEERMRTDFRTKAHDVIQLRLVSSDQSRIAESYAAVISRVNALCLRKFSRDMEREAVEVAQQRNTRSEAEDFYWIFLKKLNLAVAYEMTLQHQRSLELYSEANTDLEEALSMFADSQSPPQWLEGIRKAPCTSWDYPKLVWAHLSWRYLAPIQEGTSPLLHTRTFLLVRISHLLFLLDRAWTVSELCIATLHCMAREIKLLKLTLPLGAFNCWAYMACHEAVLAIMTQISPDSLLSATASSSSLLLVRAELWHYALQKLHDIGLMCCLLPSYNKLNYDAVLIKKISSGISPVSFEIPSGDPMEDQGKKLIAVLNSSSAYQREYLSLGEMVIGAFKHAGRRRMAFRVGTMMAQFHRDLGLVDEAEELLSDICKCYSEDQWTQLSTRAYSLLADCQRKLNLEEKHVGTMLLLASFPPYPPVSHDPSVWFDQLKSIANVSPYQKILNWTPLLDLLAIRLVGVSGRRDKSRRITTGDRIDVEIVLDYNGPKEMKPIITTVTLRRTGQLDIVSSSSGRRFALPDVQADLPLLVDSLDELSLESDLSSVPNSRPIGGLSRARTTLSVTHISSSDIAEMEEEGRGEEGRRWGIHEAMFVTTGGCLQPGENRVKVSGEMTYPGQYSTHKVSLKWGSLDFLLTVPPSHPHTLTLPVHPSRVVLELSIVSELGVFLSGYEHSCHLCIKTGKDTIIPDGSPLRLAFSSAMQCKPKDLEATRLEERDGVTELTLPLPAIAGTSGHTLPLSLCIPSHPPSPSCDQTGQSAVAWTHEVQLYCDWLTPVHVAKIPVTVYEPLTITHREISAGENTFLLTEVQNTCPCPLSLELPTTAAEVQLTLLPGSLPKLLYPGDNFSCVWKATPGPPSTVHRSEACLSVWYQPQLDGQDAARSEFKYSFTLSTMRTIYEVRASLSPSREEVSSTSQPSYNLQYQIRNTTLPGETIDSTHFPAHLEYQVTVDPSQWTLLEKPTGGVEGPGAGQLSKLCLRVFPASAGALPYPRLTLSASHEKGPDEAGSKVVEEGRGCVPLSGAQLYDLSRGDVVTVNLSSTA